MHERKREREREKKKKLALFSSIQQKGRPFTFSLNYMPRDFPL